MSKIRRVSGAVLRFARPALALAMLGLGASTSVARDAGSPANFDQRSKYRYSYEYYRRRGDFGRPGERLSPNDPRGHMSHGHGAGHL